MAMQQSPSLATIRSTTVRYAPRCPSKWLFRISYSLSEEAGPSPASLIGPLLDLGWPMRSVQGCIHSDVVGDGPASSRFGDHVFHASEYLFSRRGMARVVSFTVNHIAAAGDNDRTAYQGAGAWDLAEDQITEHHCP